ncbi:MAG: hypothetical protein AAFV88_06390 [Planctomycetota bacterium]
MLTASVVMPFAVGCDKQTVIVPLTSVSNAVRSNDSIEAMGDLLLHWPYLFALAYSLLLITVGLIRPKRLGHWLLPLPFVFLVPMVLLGFLAVWLDESAPQERVVLALVGAAPQSVLLAFVIHSTKNHDTVKAAVRGLSGLSGLSAIWLYFQAVAAFSSRLLYGFYVSVFSSLVLLLTTWTLYTQGEQSLSDTRKPRRLFQFRIRTLLIWTTLIAIVIAVLEIAG